MELIHGHSICSGIADGEIQIFRRRPKEAAAWTGVDSISILPAEEVLRQSGFREESLSADEEAERAAERYQVFLVPGLVLLLAGAALSKGRFRRRPPAADVQDQTGRDSAEEK